MRLPCSATKPLWTSKLTSTNMLTPHAPTTLSTKSGQGQETPNNLDERDWEFSQFEPTGVHGGIEMIHCVTFQPIPLNSMATLQVANHRL